MYSFFHLIILVCPEKGSFNLNFHSIPPMRKVKKVKREVFRRIFFFAERLKLSLKPSTVLSTVTGELPEFHGNQTSAVSFWFRTSEKNTFTRHTPQKNTYQKQQEFTPPKNNYAKTTPKTSSLDKLLVRLKVSTSMIFVSANSWSA